ncbi:MAG: DPP IV N-terminal domain-containing protein [Acidobacteria bacterium]|jgi:dipeptidyl-peptidase-4|nr:DPP IV N-terminal domain-containing protein [Acidobacteriota bacterium]
MKTIRALAAILLLAAVPGLCQEHQRMSVEWVYSEQGVNATRMPEIAWTAGDDLLLLDHGKPETERTIERYTPSTGERRPAVDAAAALASLKAQLGEADTPKALPWPESFDGAGRRALYTFGGDLFVLDLASSSFRRLTHTPEAESAARLSPDGRRAAFVRNHDLYVADIATGAETRLTRDGSATVLNGALSWVYWEEIFDHDAAGYWWSPDSTAIAFLRSDEAPVSEVVFPDITPAVPRVLRQRYPKAGGANPIVTLGVADLASGTTVFVPKERMPYEYILGVRWLPDGRRLAVQVTNRAQTRLDLYLVERAGGTPTRILSDPDRAWVDQQELQFAPDGSQFVWSSQRDGYTHLYLYRSDGTLIRKLTAGDWSVRGPASFYAEALDATFVDWRGGFVYFIAMKDSPVERQLYRVRLDGTGLERLTSEAGVHWASFSPDRRYWSEVRSAHCTPPSLVVHDTAGGRERVLASSLPGLLETFDWQCPQLVTVPAPDGHPLQVRLIKPRGFDPAKKYPAIVYIYGGPAAPVVKDSFDYSFALNAKFDQILADRGYVVMNVDPRSATGASKTDEDTVLGKVWSDVELGDMVAGVRWLKSHPWVDGTRVGVWGWSGGGTSTVLLMTRSKEFKAGIAIAPVTDWHFYDTKFAETFMKTPADNPEGYEHTSLLRYAKDLHGRIMLVLGTHDDNVHPQNTWNFVDRLLEAGKPFDVMVYPMRKHIIGDRAARIDLYKRMLEYWQQHL